MNEHTIKREKKKNIADSMKSTWTHSNFQKEHKHAWLSEQWWQDDIEINEKW